MISRHWKGVANNDSVEDFIDYLREETFERAREIDGFVTGHILTRKLGHGTEFCVITEWENIEIMYNHKHDDNRSECSRIN